MAESSWLSDLGLVVFVLAFTFVLTFWRFFLRKLIWAIAIVVRRDEHTADTNEWLEQTFGIEPSLDGMPSPVAETLESEPEAAGLADPIAPERRISNGSCWMSMAKMPLDRVLRNGREAFQKRCPSYIPL